MANRIADFRERANLSQRALGALLGTSRQQIARLESGRQVSPDFAHALARALGVQLSVLFPDVGAQSPETDLDWQRLGFDLDAPRPTWHLNIQLRGFPDSFEYLADYQDCIRIQQILEQPSRARFVAFESCGRSIYLNAEEVQRISALDDSSALAPGVQHDIGRLYPEYASLHVYFRGGGAAMSADGFDMDAGGIEKTFGRLAGDLCSSDDFLAFHDDEGDDVRVRVGEIALAEVPTQALLEEIEDQGEGFFDSSYERLEFEGRSLPASEADMLLPALAQASAVALKRHTAGLSYQGPKDGASTEILQSALSDAMEALRLHGYTILRGAPLLAWSIEERGCWAPLHDALFDAFAGALRRSRQHGNDVGTFTRDKIRVALFGGLAALREEGYRIAPDDRYIDYEPGHGWGDSGPQLS